MSIKVALASIVCKLKIRGGKEREKEGSEGRREACEYTYEGWKKEDSREIMLSYILYPNNSCWLSIDNGVIAAFIAPMIIIILVSIRSIIYGYTCTCSTFILTQPFT